MIIIDQFILLIFFQVVVVDHSSQLVLTVYHFLVKLLRWSGIRPLSRWSPNSETSSFVYTPSALFLAGQGRVVDVIEQRSPWSWSPAFPQHLMLKQVDDD